VRGGWLAHSQRRRPETVPPTLQNAIAKAVAIVRAIPIARSAPRRVRLESMTPNFFSMRVNAWLNAGCAISSTSAARVTMPVSTMARKCRR